MLDIYFIKLKKKERKTSWYLYLYVCAYGSTSIILSAPWLFKRDLQIIGLDGEYKIYFELCY
jgi:hypothetical protein